MNLGSDSLKNLKDRRGIFKFLIKFREFRYFWPRVESLGSNSRRGI
jgi:hypothetical protein